jgi:hypothetical protein
MVVGLDTILINSRRSTRSLQNVGGRRVNSGVW